MKGESMRKGEGKKRMKSDKEGKRSAERHTGASLFE
jgi:hypothetical protein